MATKHTFRSRYGIVTVENGALTVGPPLDDKGFADARWVRELHPDCEEWSLLEDAGDELLNRAVDVAWEAANELMNCDEVCDDPDCDSCRDFTVAKRLRVVPKCVPRRSQQ